MTPREYIQFRTGQEAIIKQARGLIQDALDKALDCPLPKSLRPATADDLARVGNVIWYPADDHREAFWAEVVEPLYHGDAWKAFRDENGSDYGLRGAFVEIDP